MMKRILIASLAAASLLQVPAMAAHAADTDGSTASPNYTLCKLLPWLPSCKLLMEK